LINNNDDDDDDDDANRRFSQMWKEMSSTHRTNLTAMVYQSETWLWHSEEGWEPSSFCEGLLTGEHMTRSVQTRDQFS
jgi:hypothetical protein